MNSGSLMNVTYKLFAYKSYISVCLCVYVSLCCVCVCVCVFVREQDLALNNPQVLICHETQPSQTKQF